MTNFWNKKIEKKKYFIKFLEKFLRKNSRRTLVDEQKNCRKHLTRKKIRDFLKREIHEEKLRKWKSNLEWKKFPPRSQEKVIFEKKFWEKNWNFHRLKNIWDNEIYFRPKMSTVLKGHEFSSKILENELFL